MNLADLLMERGVLKNADARELAAEIEARFAIERAEAKVALSFAEEAASRFEKQRAEALAKCAEMREALARPVWFCNGSSCTIDAHSPDCSIAARDHALSSECGKGFVRASELDKTVEEMTKAFDVVNEVAAYGSCDCDTPNGDVCTYCAACNLVDPLKAELARLGALRK